MIQSLFIKTAVWVCTMALILFGVGGTLNWPAAWIFLGTWAAFVLSASMWLARHDPALLAERLKPVAQKQQPRGDKIFFMTLGPTMLAWFVVIALDAARYQSSYVPAWMQVLGFATAFLALVAVLCVLRENTFAASVVRVQSERGHHVITTGPYAYLRHPMYAAVIPLCIGVPLLLGSWWGLAFAPAFVGLFMARIVIEERTLNSLLKGYTEYTTQVPYRLIPGLW